VAARGRRELVSLVRLVDIAMREYQRPAYHEEPSPHISVAWTTKTIEDGELAKRLAAMTIPEDSACCLIDRVLVKSGSTLFSIDLANPQLSNPRTQI
jgi:hypothetical protein